MVAPRDDDSMRIAESPEGGSPDERPRIFVWGDPVEKPSLFRRILRRLWGRGDRSRPRAPGPAKRNEVAPPVVRPAVGRRLTDDGRAREGAEGRWDPPDLSAEGPPTPPAGRVQDAAAASSPGHGPGPLSRATLQLLPGRLRPLDPDIVREEIRFVRSGHDTTTVTLGWAEGEPPGHVTVSHPSVRDRHARMSFRQRQWWIESLVATHPVRVNGEALPAGAEPRELRSGDEVRLGEATFHFLMP